jgi:hypothetical protein
MQYSHLVADAGSPGHLLSNGDAETILALVRLQQSHQNVAENVCGPRTSSCAAPTAAHLQWSSQAVAVVDASSARGSYRLTTCPAGS